MSCVRCWMCFARSMKNHPRSPSPGLASLSDLVSRASEAGLQVHTEVSGDLKGLPASVDLAAFRIVQEALTNVMRHSGQTTSSVYVTCNRARTHAAD